MKISNSFLSAAVSATLVLTSVTYAGQTKLLTPFRNGSAMGQVDAQQGWRRSKAEIATELTMSVLFPPYGIYYGIESLGYARGYRKAKKMEDSTNKPQDQTTLEIGLKMFGDSVTFTCNDSEFVLSSETKE